MRFHKSGVFIKTVQTETILTKPYKTLSRIGKFKKKSQSVVKRPLSGVFTFSVLKVSKSPTERNSHAT